MYASLAARPASTLRSTIRLASLFWVVLTAASSPFSRLRSPGDAPPAAGEQDLSGHVRGVGGAEEADDASDLVGLGGPARRHRDTRFSSTGAGIACVIGVSTRPGATAFTRTRGACSSASARVTPISADLAAA